MLVIYLLNNQPNTLETQAEEDLRELAEEIRQQLRARHPELADDRLLPLRINEGVLNGLADGSQEIALGELAASA